MTEKNKARRWGPWWLDLDTMHLVLDEHSADVGLERCETASQTLEEVGRIAGKAWATAAIVGHLTVALDALLGLHRIASGERTDARRIVPDAVALLEWVEQNEHKYKNDPWGFERARQGFVRAIPPLRATSMKEGFERVIAEAEKGPDTTDHGPWKYDADSDWLSREGHGWGVSLSQLEAGDELAAMMDHLEGKSFCTPQLLGQFWIAARYWLRVRQGGVH